MVQQNILYSGPMLDVEPHHHPEPCLVSYGGVTMFPPPGNRTTFDPRSLPENHGQIPYMISHLVHGQLVQAIPAPWSGQHSVTGGFSWDRAHGVPYLQDIALHGYQVAPVSRNLPAFIHSLPPMRPHHGHHIVYHPPLPPPPLPPPCMLPLQPHSMDMHLQLPSTLHRHPTSTSTTHPFHNDADHGPRFVGTTMPRGVMVYEPLMIDSIAWHHSFPRFRVLPDDEQGEQFGNKDSGLSDDFISDHLKTRTFDSSRPLPADEGPNFCVICQMDFEDQEKIRVLDCRHEYHVECIKKWLSVKNNCPLCKSTAFK